jgi:hypothetical protein
MKFKDFYIKENTPFEDKNAFNKSQEDVDEMKQKISDMFRSGMTVEDIESKLKVKLDFPRDNEKPDQFIISKTYTIVKESEEHLNAWGQDEKTAKEVRKRLREERKQNRINKYRQKHTEQKW